MEDTDDKKRRNLMITATAVLVAAFLGLQLPSLILFGSVSSPHLISDPSRLWVVVSVLIAYQGWRFLTDPKALKSGKNAAGYFERVFQQALAKSLVRAATVQMKGGRPLGYKISFAKDITEGSAIDWRCSSLSVDLGYSVGHALPHSEICKRESETSLSYALVRAGGHQSIGGVGMTYRLPFWAVPINYLRAAVRTLLRSSESQDLFVPVLLGLLALSVSIWKVCALWVMAT